MIRANEESKLNIYTTQRNSIKDGPKHEESCFDLVFIDDVGRVLEKDVIIDNFNFNQLNQN